MGYLTFILFFALEIFFASQIAILVQVTGCFKAALALGNRQALLFFRVKRTLVEQVPAAFRLNS
ncbi:MAG: hypothetical protein ABI947_23080 [Chloroflexota bacterium]